MIYFIVFVCGAVVMSFEILGSRVLAPNFGNSVFVWGSLISVFLTGLSAGYYLGGRIADIRPSSKKLGLIIIAPGVLLLTFPLYSGPVSDWIFMKDLGVRSSPLLASAILFLVPSVFLGIVSPYTAKLMICSLHTSGKTIGTLYALSTFGSIIGTLITSFYLITIAGVSSLIMGQGILLIILAMPLLFMKLQCGTDYTGSGGGK
ncbi:MAG: fused MFS/spermidine synthase [Nitrospirae bacterium]|nr:fused MFS/spermidine synthase [Nitrospirota bacterium]MBI4847265.1 fused MFS/spermidine synthase [Nitrospirota bacterium]